MLTVLLTGATSGIGHATARTLVQRGHRVIAAGRDEVALAAIRNELGVVPLRLDLTDADSIDAAVRHALEVAPEGIDVLVNNAGMGVLAPMAEIDPADLRRQFETNVFGLVALTQRLVPHMRDRGRGRIINVSSIGGRMTLPLFGGYNATKHALESISDAFRYELAAFGIDVVLVEPGVIRTSFSSRAAHDGRSYLNASGPYARAMTRGMDLLARADLRAAPALRVARTIADAVEARRPRARYVVPRRTVMALWLLGVLPTRWTDALLRRVWALDATPPALQESPAA
ncbi:MAG TPA: SDR family NAD(P)-dependent oxidoreductase [Nannocystaceae bacterium]|nr:SDR family NAD(P)-dependent oxidoreductase [Nannocystaceae bacterium]